MKLLPLLSVPLVGARVIGNQQQIPVLENVVEELVSGSLALSETTEQIAPGIGIHFTTSYAVAAARYQNGTIQDLAKMKGDAEYVELMSRWMTSYSTYNLQDDCNRVLSSPSKRFESSRFKCNMDRADRRARKLLGRPPSRDAATLARFLSKYRSVIEMELGSPIESIAPTIFKIRPEQEQDLGDALEFAGLRSARERPRYMFSGLNTAFVDSEANAAFAGLGMGMCKDWTDQSKCVAETKKVPERTVVFINFDNSSLSASAYQIATPYKGVAYNQIATPYKGVAYNQVATPELGWWHMPVFEVPRARFWSEIHEVVVKVASGLWAPPGRIVLMGEHAADKEFREVVEAALWSVLEFDVSFMLQANKADDATYIAARGAAELAWRQEYWTRAKSDHDWISEL